MLVKAMCTALLERGGTRTPSGLLGTLRCNVVGTMSESGVMGHARNSFQPYLHAYHTTGAATTRITSM